MKKISKEEVINLGGYYAGFFQTTPLFVELEKLEIGEGLVIKNTEWSMKGTPNSTFLNNVFKKFGMEKGFRIKSMQYGKEFLIIRKK